MRIWCQILRVFQSRLPQVSQSATLHISSQAKMFAKDDKKWMLVNIQSHLEFSSQMMNRDTFVDETVITLLRTSFVFWQRGTIQQSNQIHQ